ncbi:MAG: hypothetical protein LBR56_08125, partial [Sporomusaceae bacterium]|nr:hypothetical protein [Sporomusaceae bacterium]
MLKKIKTYLHTNWQYALNIYIFLNFGSWCAWSAYQSYLENRLDLVEISFLVSNVVLVFIFLLRKPHQQINTNLYHQTIALLAFCSGAALMGTAPTGGAAALFFSQAVIITANVIGVATLLNLGRSFGILIAFREIKTTGLYGIIRHPMYFTDILLRIGYLISHLQPIPILIVLASSACYVYRAILEERFLAQQPEYAAYMQKVKYRFI